MTYPSPFCRAALPACALVLGVWVAFFFSTDAAQAQQHFGEAPRYRVRLAPTSIAPEEICVLHPRGVVPEAAVQARARLRLKRPAYQKAASFEVDYTGFDGADGQEAQEAFQRAVDIWAEHIDSPVTIKIAASFEELGEDVLGSAGPNQLWFLIDENAPEDVSCTGPSGSDFCTLYGDALADAVLRENVAEQEGDDVPDDAPDIIARFSSEASWYYGTGEPASNQVDFTSVVLHELGHGLGFFGSMTVENADTTDADDEGVWPFNLGNPDVPTIYDRFAVDEDGTLLINTDVYPNPSDALRQALTSGDVFFEGDGALTGNDGVVPELYAPADWNQGSSYSHLDEDTYPEGDPNALMSPQIRFREVVDNPGAITCGMFEDMGWGMGPACQVLLRTDLETFTVAPLIEGGVRALWVTKPTTDKDRFVLQRRAFDESAYETVATLTTADGERGEDGRLRFDRRFPDLGVGRYTFRLRLIDTDAGGEEAFSLALAEPNQVTVDLLGAEGEKIEVDLLSAFDAALSWRVPPPTEGFRYGTFAVQRCAGTAEECAPEEGDGGAYETIGTVEGMAGEQTLTREEATTPLLLGPGNYAYRIAMEVIDTEGENEGESYVVLSDEKFLTAEDDFDLDTFALSAIYPNPAAGPVTFNLTVEEAQDVTVAVYNTLGQRVRQVSRRLGGGQAEAFTLESAGLPSGLYLVRVSGSAFEETRRVVLVR